MIRRIAIHSVPRSGSSWVGQIFNSSSLVNYKLQPLFSYAFKNALSLQSNKEEIISFFNNIAKSNDEFINGKQQIKSGKYPVFEKNNNFSFIVYKEVRYHHLLKHLMEVDDELIVIGLIRNPKAVINSWFNAPKEFKKNLNWKRDEEWLNAPSKNLDRIEEFNGFNKWLECFNIFSYLKECYPNRFIEINYDNLLLNTEATVRKIFEFCNLPWNEQTKKFLINSRKNENNDPYSVFKKKEVDNSWESELEISIIKEIDDYLKINNIDEYS